VSKNQGMAQKVVVKWWLVLMTVTMLLPHFITPLTPFIKR